MRIWLRGAPAADEFGPDLEPFRDGLAVLLREGRPAGHVATSLGHFRTLFAPRTPKPGVWIVVMWADGVKEWSVEDYPPWTYVREMRDGYLDWQDGRNRDRAGRYEIQWVEADLVQAERERLGIQPDDF